MADGIYAGVIRTREDFFMAFGLGDVFWYMKSYEGKPHSVVGPCRISGVYYRHPSMDLYVDYVEIGSMEMRSVYVGDLTDEYHGIFLDGQSARAYLEERKRMYAQDPYFMARIQRQKEEIGRLQFFGERA